MTSSLRRHAPAVVSHLQRTACASWLRVLVWLVLVITTFASFSAHAACSPHRSPQKVWFNEYFFGSGGGAPPNFLEVYSTSPSFPAVWQNWSIDVYSSLNTKTTYPLNNSTATACTIANKTWLTTNVPGGLRSQDALVLLRDENGDYIDAFVFDNRAPPNPWPSNAAASRFPGLADPTTGCPALANDLTTQAGLSGSTPKQFNMLVLSNFGNKDMARDPDGGPIWDLTSNTGSGTTYTQCVSNNANFTKTVDNAIPTPGSTVTFTLNFANTGNGSMSGVQITDFLPPVLTYVSATPTNPADPAVTTGTYSTTDPNTGLPATATSVFWSPASVAQDTTSSLHIKMQVPANATPGHNFVNTAQTTAGVGENQTDFANITIGSLNTPSFAITVDPASASICTPVLQGPKVTITAMSAANGGGTPLTTYNGTATLTASSPNVRWYNLAGTQLTTNEVTLQNGVAELYVGLDANNNAAENVTVSALDATYVAPDLMQGQSDTIAFTSGSTAVILTDVDTLSPAYGAVAGRPHAVQARVTNCGTTASTTGALAGTIRYVPGLNHPSGAAAPTINPTAPSCPGSVTPALSTGGTAITLNFSAGIATFYLCSTDVGHYALSLTVNSISTTGASPNFTVRPFVVTATDFTSASGANQAGAGRFTAAGSNFTGTLRAHRWLPSADTESSGRGNGVPDAGITAANIIAGNPGLTASFAGTVNNAGVVTFAPELAPPVPADALTYTLGTLTPGTATLNAGAVTLSESLSYSEVGNFRVRGNASGSFAAANYLGTSGLNVPLLSDVVGRIVPSHFIVTAPSQVSRIGCAPASTFTYMDEPFTIGFSLSARNAAGALTENYKGSYAFLDGAAAQWNSTATVPNGSFGMAAFNGATDLSTRLTTVGSSPLGWIGGTNTFNATLRFARDAAGPQAPIDALALGVVPRDADGVTVLPGALTLNASRVPLLPNRVVHGRLKLFSRAVPGVDTMNMPIQTQYWSGKSWVMNSDDSCTVIPQAAVFASNYRDGKSVGMPDWPLAVGGATTITGGQGTIALSKPNTMRAGTVDVCVDLGADPGGGVSCSATPPTPADAAYLKGKWAPGTTEDNDPTARATFGVYAPETKRTVHVRELY